MGANEFYLLIRTNRVKVRLPTGEIIEHTLRRSLAFPASAARLIGYDLHFEYKGHTLIVLAGLVEKVEVVSAGE